MVLTYHIIMSWWLKPHGYWLNSSCSMVKSAQNTLIDLVCWCLSWTWEMAQKIVSDTSSLLRMLLIFLIQDDWSPTVILKIRTSCEQSPQLRMSPAPWWFFSMLQQCPDPCFSENIFNVVSVRMRNMNIDSRSCICVWRMSKVKIN